MPKPNWVLLSGDSLVGKELRELVRDRKLPVSLQLCSALEDGRVLTEEDGEPSVMEPLTEEILRGAQVVFAGEGGLKAVAMSRKLDHPPVFIDLTGHLEDLPEAQVRAPMIDNGALVAASSGIQVIAHPAALVLARFLVLLHKAFPFSRAVVNVMEPASAHGRPGVDEMHKQTVDLLAFRGLTKDLFDAQVTFNILPRFGDDAKFSLEKSEQRMDQHLASLLSPLGTPLPSLRVFHAPVFHGYQMSIWVEFVMRPLVADVQAMFSSNGVDVRTSQTEPPSNLAIAGQSGLTLGEISEDRNAAKACWFWLAADNIRATAENALLVAGLAARART